MEIKAFVENLAEFNAGNISGGNLGIQLCD